MPRTTNRRDNVRRDTLQSRPNIDGAIQSGAQNNGCGCLCAEDGPIDLLGVKWKSTYLLPKLTPIFGDVLITNQGDYWESGEYTFDCGDVYKWRMTPSGYLARQIELKTIFVSGGGYSGEKQCCDGQEFRWVYSNPTHVDPLCTMQFTREPAQILLPDCYNPPCRICVTPHTNTVLCGETPLPEFLRIEPSGPFAESVVACECFNDQLPIVVQWTYGTRPLDLCSWYASAMCGDVLLEVLLSIENDSLTPANWNLVLGLSANTPGLGDGGGAQYLTSPTSPLPADMFSPFTMFRNDALTSAECGPAPDSMLLTPVL